MDYTAWKNHVLAEIESTVLQWQEEGNSIYMVSLDCSRGMDSVGLIANTTDYLQEQAEEGSDDYWYYKYCEEEWKLFQTFGDASAILREYKKANQDLFTDPDTCLFTTEFDLHCEKVIEACKDILTQSKQSSLAKSNPNLLLTVYIRDYFDEEERIEIFEMLNDEKAAKDYAEHSSDFI